MIRYESVYVYFIATKNVGDYSYMSSPNIYYRAINEYIQQNLTYDYMKIKVVNKVTKEWCEGNIRRGTLFEWCILSYYRIIEKINLSINNYKLKQKYKCLKRYL